MSAHTHHHHHQHVKSKHAHHTGEPHPSPVLLGIGNPLLDISANVDVAYLSKYSIKPGLASLAEQKDLPVYADLVSNHKVDYTAGGATQNSIRVAQWMVDQPNATCYLGAVGKDNYSEELKKSAGSDGVNVAYQVVSDQPTGTCAVLVVDKERSLVANLGAANHFKPEHLNTEEVKTLVAGAKVFYSAGFFLTVSPPALLQIAQLAADKNKIMGGNLSAPFICEFFYQPLMDAVPYYDFLFGNESEAIAWGTKHGLKGDDLTVSGVAKALSKLPKKNDKRPRTVIITQGKNPTVVAINGEVKEHSFEPIDPKLIVDLNGAGDAFVGGFLSVLTDPAVDLTGPVSETVLKRAIDAGHYAASQIIQVSGIVLNGKPKKF